MGVSKHFPTTDTNRVLARQEQHYGNSSQRWERAEGARSPP